VGGASLLVASIVVVGVADDVLRLLEPVGFIGLGGPVDLVGGERAGRYVEWQVGPHVATGLVVRG
jgi:hypothetical protein